MGFGQRDFSTDDGEDLVQPATVNEVFEGGVTADQNYTAYTAPRFMTCDVAGTLKYDDWEDNTITRNIIAGQLLPLRPKKLYQTGSTAKVILEW